MKPNIFTYIVDLFPCEYIHETEAAFEKLLILLRGPDAIRIAKKMRVKNRETL